LRWDRVQSQHDHGAGAHVDAFAAQRELVDSYESLDTMVKIAAENPGERILVDLAAQTHERLVKWIDESGVIEALADNGLSLTY
jgi:hypothetical protein